MGFSVVGKLLGRKPAPWSGLIFVAVLFGTSGLIHWLVERSRSRRVAAELAETLAFYCAPPVAAPPPDGPYR
jgi:hypothetical protein